MENVYPFWKKYGETLRETRERFLIHHPELREKKIRYEGRLDPLAEGILLFLEGRPQAEVRYYSKSYSVEILVGVSTDSGDLLGIPRPQTQTLTLFSHWREVLADALEKKERKGVFPIPRFASPHLRKLLRGETLSEYREKEMHFSKIRWSAFQTITENELQKKLDVLNRIPHSFRTRDILRAWEHFLQERKTISLASFHCSCDASSGSYIRTLLSLIAQETGIPLSSIRITRTRFGPYTENR